MLSALARRAFNVIIIVCKLTTGGMKNGREQCSSYTAGAPAGTTAELPVRTGTYGEDKSNAIEPKHVKRISGSTFALMIIRFVGCALVVVIGILFNYLMGYFGSEGFASLFLRKKAEIDRYVAVVKPILSGISAILMIILIVCAVIAFVIAFLGIGAIHKFVKSTYTSAETGVLDIKAAKTTRGWLIAFAVFFGIDAFSCSFYLPTLVQYGCMCAAMILLSKLVKQYYGDIR